MENKVELKVNVINQLRLLRQSTFKDKLCFLDEDFQNAQRAKAKNVKVYTSWDDEDVIIENDGDILKDPQCLFSIAESGWDDEVKKSENPFGMGFFSNITVSDCVEIYSGNLHILFDVNKMINTNNTDIQIEEVDEFYQGFKLILHNFDYDSVSRSYIKERVQLLGKYIQELEIYYNDEIQEKKDLTEGDDSIFQTQINEENFKGWIALDRYGWSNNVNIFYKGRLVCKLENSTYLKGDIHVDDRTLNLTSPDRKDIIRDEKYSKFRQDFRVYVESLCEEALLYGDEEYVEEYASAISYYINNDKIKNKIRFSTFKNERDLDYIRRIASIKKNNKKDKIENFKQVQLFLNKESEQQESKFEEVVIEAKIESKVPYAKGVIVHESTSSYEEGYTERPKISEKQIEERKGEEIIVTDIPTFWMSFNEIVDYEYKLNIIKHYNLKLIISRNKIESEILRGMKNTHNVLHISELSEDITIMGYLTNTELNKKEERASMILDMVSRILGKSHNIFAIGDLMVTKTISIKAINNKYELIEPDIAIIKDFASDKVYIDRSIIDISELKDTKEGNLCIEDYKFILTNIYDIISEASILIEGKTREEIMKQVLLTLGMGMI